MILLGLDQLGGGPPPMGGPGLMDPTGGAAPSPEPPADDEDPWALAMDAIRAAAQADGKVDPQEAVIVEQITTLIAKLQAGRHKEEQAALGGGPATSFLRRNSG